LDIPCLRTEDHHLVLPVIHDLHRSQATVKNVHYLYAIAAVMSLAACSTSRLSTDSAPILLPPIPRTISCERPLLLPDAALTRAQVEQLWARDRANLVKCGASLETLITYYEGLAASLRAAAK
jgi:hypothetical protein